MERSALRLEVTARPRLEVVDTSLERFLAKRDIVRSAAESSRSVNINIFTSDQVTILIIKFMLQT